MKKGAITITSIILVTLFSSCMKDKWVQEDNNGSEGTIGIYEGFDFSTVSEKSLLIQFYDYSDAPMNNVYSEIYTRNPLLENGTLHPDAESFRLFEGISNSSGQIKAILNPPKHIESLFILTHHAGLETLREVGMEENQQVIIGGARADFKSMTSKALKGMSNNPPTLVNGFYTLGAWNTYGVPDYLENENDFISQDFLQNVNASLPEYSPLPQSHPQYLANDGDANLEILENGEVWVTFVHEGAGWHNTLGYYTYPTGSTPTQVSAITDRTLIFPDVSNHSNGLTPGNKVQLKYLDPATNTYTNLFPAGTTIGWFLIAKGWTNQTVGNGIYAHYSDVNLNTESNTDLRKHNVLLYDEDREILLMGFEDIKRDNSGCDNDFNDAIFFTSVNPITAVDVSAYQPIDEPGDADNDGVTDVFDAYPNDPNKAFANFYPGEQEFGTLVYEDLWPFKGDYDFNDLVLEYNFEQITNNQNLLTALTAKIVVKAIGASYHNGFGISLNTDPNNVSSITGQRISKNYLSIASNGTEEGQSKAVVILFDDAYNVLHYTGNGLFVNTDPASPYATPDTITVSINFINPISFDQIGTPPYNPFMIVNRNRGVEVHLPNSPPTDLVDQSLLGTGHDDSNSSLEKYYVSDVYLPWAMNLPVSFTYPIEKQKIDVGHKKFDAWARSNGYSYMDWYLDKPNYRSVSHLYSKN